MDNVISGFHQLSGIDHVACFDGPGWLMAVIAGWIIIIVCAAIKDLT